VALELIGALRKQHRERMGSLDKRYEHCRGCQRLWEVRAQRLRRLA
jgi:hypothetical protein